MKRTISILVVDDDEDDFVLLKSFLEDLDNYEFNLQWTPDYKSALQLMKKNSHDIAIVDYLMGSHTGLELLKTAMDEGCRMPVILLTGKGSHKIDVEAMSLGASDFLVKTEINSEKLERSIRYAIERSENLHALTESEEKYRNIFESSRDMIYVTDEQGNFLDVNESSRRILGYSKEELKNTPAKNLYTSPGDRDKFLKALRQSGTITNYELTLKDKAGEKKFCLISASIQHNPQGEFYILGVLHDITHRKKTERDLVVAEKLAMTGRVARMLAHEIRNPLTNINLTIEQLEYEAANTEFETYFGMIKRNTRRISDLINELLLSSRPADVTTDKRGLTKIINDTLEMAMDRITLKNVSVEKYISDDICEVEVDEMKIKTALLNIIINAVEAVPEKGGRIKISGRKEGDRCIIEIEDNGHGIAQENVGKLFEPYFTIKEGGMGLGLATAHNIIQSHGGTIEVESELRKGTKFAIGLKL
ncbi:MAG: PAS domain S-box protein [Bacteroidota bacterium]